MGSEVLNMATKATFVLSDEARDALKEMARVQRRSMTGVLEYLLLNPSEASEDHLRDAYQKGYEEAYDKGYEAGREKGQEDAQEAYEEKLTEEYERGYEAGREKSGDQ